MTHRERVLTALHRREPDRVPLFYRDEPEVEQRLRQDLALNDREALLRFFDIDFRWVGPEYVGPSLYDERTARRRDIWGVEYAYTRFSERAGYWEPITHPLAAAERPADLDDYPWPRLEWFDFSTLPGQVDLFDEYAIMTAPGFASPGLLQSPIQSLVGVEKALIDMAINPGFLHALTQHIMAFLAPFVDQLLEAAGERIDFLRVGDDYGTQKALLTSPRHWRAFIHPALKQLADIAKDHGAYFYLHSCGAVRELIPDLIETGVDVLDPLQVKATGMIPAELKRAYGDQMCFCGGVDEQELLPRGTPGEIRSAVHQLLDTMCGRGGFVLGPTHNFQDDIPTENIVAMYQAAKEWHR